MSHREEHRESASDSDQVAGKLLLDSLIGALSLGAMGSFLGAFFLPSMKHVGAMLGLQVELPKGWWAYGVLGLALGSVAGLIKSWGEVRRRRGMREAAASTGLVFSPEGTQQLERGLRGLLDHNQSLYLANVLQKEVGAARFYVADLKISTPSGDGHSESNQTVAYFEASDLPFPTFTLQPEGRVLSIFSSLVGNIDINFEGFPEFSRRYHLSGDNPEAVRRLFTDDLLTSFGGDPGWQIRARENRLLMFRHNRHCQPAELQEFMNQAVATFSLFFDALQERADSLAAAPPLEAREQAAPFSGPLGRIIRSRLVTRREVDDFLAQSTPRQIPANIKRQQTGGGLLFFCIWGAMFGGIGSIVLLAMLAAGEWRWTLFGALFPLIGFSVLFFAVRNHRRGVRLLRDGKLTEAKIESLAATSMWVNGQRRYRVSLRFSAAGDNELRTFSIYGTAVRRAEDCLAKAEPVRVLYLPDQPDRCTLVDSLITDGVGA